MGVLPIFLIVRPQRARRIVWPFPAPLQACSYLLQGGGLDLSLTARIYRARPL